MRPQDWALLGIAPTTELGAIKKAYAVKLKVTRPDDDAEAYQALRTAYERAQQWVKWRQEEAEETWDDEQESAPAPLVEQAPDPLPLAPAEPPLPAEPALRAEALVEELDGLWRRAGHDALLRGWASARHTLDQQPLHRQREFSAEFAQWVLRNPGLPVELLNPLNDHFGWLDDFRTERLLGVPLTHALHEALGPRLRPAPLPEPVQEMAGPLHALAVLRDGPGAWWRLPWLFFLLQPLLTRNLDQLGADWLERLGLPKDWLSSLAQRAFWTRLSLATALCWVVGFLALDDAVAAIGRTAFWLVATIVFLFLALMAGVLIGAGPNWKAGGGGRIGQLLDRWRRHPAQPWLGLAWLLFAALLAWVHESPAARAGGGLLALLPPEGYVLFAWGFAIAGLVVAWPLDVLRGCVTLSLVPLVGYFLTAALGAWLPEASCLLLAIAWLLVSAAVHEGRTGLPESSPARWLLRPALNSLLLMDRWTYPLAMAPLAAASAWFWLADGKARPTDVFLVWVLGILAVGWLQNKADALGLRLLQGWQTARSD